MATLNNPSIPPTVREELQRRLNIWRELKARGGPNAVPPALIKELRIHRGQQGVFRDLEVTVHLAALPAGIAVGVLHTGTRYADDLTEDGVIYHYPYTERGERDANEIAAMKACRKIDLPLFVVIKPSLNSPTRDVRLGWVQEDDDDSGQILIKFSDSDTPPPHLQTWNVDQQPFALRVERNGRHSRTKVRPNQWRFRFDVLKRYGSACAVCAIRRSELIQAAHLCSVEESGSDDPRNGLVFCLTHHRAFDAGLFRIDPDTLQLNAGDGVQTLEELGITRSSIGHLQRLPHREALSWAWSHSSGNETSTT